MRDNVPRKKTRPNKPSRPIFQLSRKQFFVWAGLTFFAMSWMFVIGILVGRGLSPVRFDVPKLKEDIVTLKDRVLPTEENRSDEEKVSPSETPELEFYKALREEGEEQRGGSPVVRRKAPVPRFPAADSVEEPPTLAAQSPEQPTEPALQDATAEEGPAERLAMIPLKRSVTKKLGDQGALTVQVAAFRKSEKAEELIAALRRKGYDAYQVSAELPGRGMYHRVRVGHYTDAQEARLAASRLKQEKLETIILMGD
jgi:cell division septation protein DedD